MIVPPSWKRHVRPVMTYHDEHQPGVSSSGTGIVGAEGEVQFEEREAAKALA